MPKHTLNMELVAEMIKNYRTRQLKSIEDSKTWPMAFDAHSVWFSLDELKDFITEIETEIASHPEKPVGNLGLRIYYAAYPTEEDWNPDLDTVPKDYEKLHTVIALPTNEIDGENFDFDPSDVNTYDGTKPTGTGIAIMAENHGFLTPPFSTTGEWF
ncbi:hypothetical protein [Flavobacterium capsici]|uniref:Uncharacterized protein n=2 Tax=Flavobacterium capsici TaxID=3075618 RepID=A0AA96JBU4_9FLAO|nr:hypothetical protein [Flavobacterium sp. PMTSA4]WNM22994.1 hypothetical protein RN605_06435 [Flavobacterium sp. PMTSA4]